MRENTVKVSIIVPAYNVEGYIEECLTSLINQTLKEIEIIVVNDGATDSTPLIIQTFAQKDSRVKIINQKNQGVSAARNAGLEIAQGEYIGFVDSDDFVDPDFFEKLYKTAKDHNADISVASILKHKKNYKKYNAKYLKVLCAETLNEKIKLCQDKKQRFFYVWNKLCKKDIIKDNNINFPIGRVFEDVTFSTKILFYANKVVSTPKTNYHYIERAGSIVKSKLSDKKKNDRILAYTELQVFAKENNFELPERLNYYNSYRQNIFCKIYEGKYKRKLMLFGVLPIKIRMS